MKDAITIDAPAKINLYLAVGRRMRDGYHRIASIFQALSLRDTLAVSLGGEAGIHLECACDCPIEQNTMYKAASGFSAKARAAGLPLPGIKIRAEKRIPAGGGLGGGSSDAAAVLRALDLLAPAVLSKAELMELAASIGSDVPFFMESACAAVRGRGELLRPVTPRLDYAALLVFPPFPVSTGAAYALLDQARVAGGEPRDEDLDAGLEAALRSFARDPVRTWPCVNDFVPAIAERYRGIGDGLAALRSAGADFACMSGSGSTLYGLFAGEERAREAEEKLRSKGFSCGIAFPLARLTESD